METKKDRIIGTLCSILLHVLIVLSFLLPMLLHKEDDKTKPTPEQSSTATLSENSASKKKDEVYMADIVEASAAQKEEECTAEKSSYFGIGIMYTFPTQTIIQAPSGYPAAQAGIRVGDVYVNSVVNGNMIDIEITRNGIPLKFEIQSQPICYQD